VFHKQEVLVLLLNAAIKKSDKYAKVGAPFAQPLRPSRETVLWQLIPDLKLKNKKNREFLAHTN